MIENDMYYDRTVSKELENLLSHDGALRWLFDFVVANNDLDIHLGRNKSGDWVSIYYGLTRILKIDKYNANLMAVSADKTYKELANQNNIKLYGKINLNDSKSLRPHLSNLLSIVRSDSRLKRYYANKKEGYYQTKFSRRFGLNNKGNEQFIVFDKEAVLGYGNEAMKAKYFGDEQKVFKRILAKLSKINAKRYGSNLQNKPLGNELDFLAVDKDSNLLLIEFKHGKPPGGIYKLPIQLGLYSKLFNNYLQRNRAELTKAVNSMISQKARIGLLPSDHPKIEKIKNVIPALVISEYNPKSSASVKFNEVLQICKQELQDKSFLSNLLIYSFDDEGKLELWPFRCN